MLSVDVHTAMDGKDQSKTDIPCLSMLSRATADERHYGVTL